MGYRKSHLYLDTMNFNFQKTIEILERTPSVLDALLLNMSPEWTNCNEGADTWSAYDIVGHLIYGEKTDWMPRTKIILSNSIDDKQFVPFDRFAQFTESKGKSLGQLLDEFKSLRTKNLNTLRAMKLTDNDLNKTGIHPAFGEVTLRQLLSTWAVHDLNHLAQAARVMAKHYKADVGPWVEYLRILNV